MYSSNTSLLKIKRKWQNILWWTLLIAVLIYFLFSKTGKQDSVDVNLTTDGLTSSPETTILLKDETPINKGIEVLSSSQPELNNFPEETKPMPTKSVNLHLPKPKVKEDVPVILSPIINKNISCGPPGKRPSVLILVITTADSVSQRNAIRSSWGLPVNSHTRYIHDRPYAFKVVFVMGRPAKWGLGKSSLQKEIEEEFSESKDILQLDFEDSKYEYTRKTKNALKWLNNEDVFKRQRCKPRFLLKVLDDVFINFPAFLHWLDAKYNESIIGINSNLYTGHLIHKDKPIRSQSHPLYVSSDDYPDQYFPDYIRSPIFLVSWNAAFTFAKVIDKVRPIGMEDAYIGLLAYKVGIRPVHNEHFVLIGRPDNVCHHLRMFFIGSVSPMEQINTFKRQRHARDLPECFGMLPYNLENDDSSQFIKGDL